MKNKIVSFIPRGKLPQRHHDATCVTAKFADAPYLLNLIVHLKQARIRKGISVRTVARKARIRAAVIQHAECHSVIPCCKDFKAWVTALDLTWENVWSEVLDSSTAGRAAGFAS